MNDQTNPATPPPSLDQAAYRTIARKAVAFELDLLASNLGKLVADIETQIAQIHVGEMAIASTYPRSPRANQLTEFQAVCAQAIKTCNQTASAFRKGYSAPIAVQS